MLSHDVLDEMPLWELGMASNKPTNMWTTIPFPFTTDENQKESRAIDIMSTLTLSTKVTRVGDHDSLNRILRLDNDKTKGDGFAQAKLPNGKEGLYKYFTENVNYPKAAKKKEK